MEEEERDGGRFKEGGRYRERGETTGKAKDGEGEEGRTVLRGHLIHMYESVMTQVGISDPTCTMTMCVRHGMQIYQSLYTYKSS